MRLKIRKGEMVEYLKNTDVLANRLDLHLDEVKFYGDPGPLDLLHALAALKEGGELIVGAQTIETLLKFWSLDEQDADPASTGRIGSLGGVTLRLRVDWTRSVRVDPALLRAPASTALRRVMEEAAPDFWDDVTVERYNKQRRGIFEFGWFVRGLHRGHCFECEVPDGPADPRARVETLRALAEDARAFAEDARAFAEARQIWGAFTKRLDACDVNGACLDTSWGSEALPGGVRVLGALKRGRHLVVWVEHEEAAEYEILYEGGSAEEACEAAVLAIGARKWARFLELTEKAGDPGAPDGRPNARVWPDAIEARLEGVNIAVSFESRCASTLADPLEAYELVHDLRRDRR